MTTETESLAALHLWLAEKLGLWQSCPGTKTTSMRIDDRSDPSLREWETEVTHLASCRCEGTERVPNVTTDGLLEALSAAGWAIWGFERTSTDGTASDTPRWYCALDNQDGRVAKDMGPTPHEALCRAARKALKAP